MRKIFYVLKSINKFFGFLIRILLKVSVCLILIVSLKKKNNNVKIKKIENIFLLIKSFVLSIKITMKKI